MLPFETTRRPRRRLIFLSHSPEKKTPCRCLSFLLQKIGGIVVIHSKQQLYLYEDAMNVMRQAALGYGADEEAAGSAALLPAEGGGAGGAAAATAAADFATLGGLGGLGPHALGAHAARGVSRAGRINLAEGDALVRVLIFLLLLLIFYQRERNSLSMPFSQKKTLHESIQKTGRRPRPDRPGSRNPVPARAAR